MKEILQKHIQKQGLSAIESIKDRAQTVSSA